jgi:hypothetical protein
MAAMPLVPSIAPGGLIRQRAGKSNSKLNGVQIGTIT